MVETNETFLEDAGEQTVRVVVDGVRVDVSAHATVLEAARTAGVDIPTLCYLQELNEIGACRVCLVEVEGI